jgi:hypothetical protein
MRNNALILLLFAAAIIGCKKDDDQPPTNNGGGGNNTGGGDGPGNVYVCGGENTGGFTDWYPRYWKDGVEHVVGDGRRGNAHAIWANDAHVTIAGMVYDGSLMMPCYWQDGNLQELNTYACGDCRAEDVFVVGENDVHLAGHVRIDDQFSTTQKAMYWHNGVGMDLTDGQHDARAFGVFVENGDVYVCGYEKLPNNRKVARYWVNGVPVVLGEGENDSEANAIWVENGNVYVAGYEEINDGAGTSEKYAVQWMNGTRTILSLNDGEAHGIHVNNGNVYVSGMVLNNSESVTLACYWVNGDPQPIHAVNVPSQGSRSADIFVHDGDVHTIQNRYESGFTVGHHANNTDQTEDFLGDAVWGIHIH